MEITGIAQLVQITFTIVIPVTMRINAHNVSIQILFWQTIHAMIAIQNFQIAKHVISLIA